MREARRFDPLSWLVSASFTILAAAGALALAVDLVRSIVPWLIGAVAVFMGLVVVRLALWWHRSRSW